MVIKLFELDISQGIPSISFERDFTHYRVLVRSHRQPLGWITLVRNGESVISSEQIQDAIENKLGQNLIRQALIRAFGIKDRENVEEGISIIVCTRNRTTQLANCLKTLLELDYPDYEIIIVDNAPSNDDTFQLTANLPVHYVREDRPGLDRARNKGIGAAKFRIVAFTDDDVLVDRYWLRAIATIFSNEAIMGASGFVAPAELETAPQYLFEMHYGGMGHGFQRRILNKENLSDKQLLWASNFGIGANMAFRKEIFKEIGDFDTALDVGTPSHGAGDVEIFHRLVTRGYYFVYEPSMLVHHFHRREEKSFRKQIFDNGRSFGCFLIDCFRKKTVSRFSIIEFFFVEWLWKWNLKNLISRRTKVPRLLSVIELYGMLTSPFAYWETKRWNKKMGK